MRATNWARDDLRKAYRKLGEMTESDNCSVCGAPWGTMHRESCKFFEAHGGRDGHAAKVCARFLLFIHSTHGEDDRLVDTIIEGMKQSKRIIGRLGMVGTVAKLASIFIGSHVAQLERMRKAKRDAEDTQQD